MEERDKDRERRGREGARKNGSERKREREAFD